MLRIFSFAFMKKLINIQSINITSDGIVIILVQTGSVCLIYVIFSFNAHYSSPRLGLYSMSVANKGVDFGVSSDFFNRKLSVNLNVRDIFGMAQWGNNTTAPSYQTTGSQRYDSRFVSLGLTWRMGKMELESKARQGATESMGTPQLN